MTQNFLFKDRLAILATKHQKERVIAPLLKTELEIKVIVPENFDTDRFGTFTRDIERPGNQIETARLKAKQALDLTGETLAIASEGSFSPHAYLPFICCDREIVLLLDRVHQIEIVGHELSTETNFAHCSVNSVEEALNFAEKIGFPEHGLIVMFDRNTQNRDEIFKGIDREEKLIESVEFALKNAPNQTIHLETDMRAMYNPTRMRAIARATQNLIAKFKKFCPQCSCPGFDVVKREPGLPCAICNFPTSLIRSEIYQCQKCQYRQEVLFPNDVEVADPSRCEYCNP
jgi:hypothetical protein